MSATDAVAMLAARDQILAQADAGDAPMPSCPPWCTLRPGHGWDSTSDRGRLRSHEGPGFGPFLVVGADEYAEAPGVEPSDCMIRMDAGTDLSESQLRALATDAFTAAEWLQNQQPADAGQIATARSMYRSKRAFAMEADKLGMDLVWLTVGDIKELARRSV